MQIVFLDRATFSSAVQFPGARLHGCRWIEYERTDVAELLERARDAQVLVTNKVRLPASVLEQLPSLRLVAVAATGVDHVDIECAGRRGIAVANVTGYAVHSVPEHVFGLILALKRNLIHYTNASVGGRWSAGNAFCLHDWPIQDLAGSVLGIIGAGQNGLGVARLGAAFGMQVLLAGRPGESPLRANRVDFQACLAQSDVVSVHVPLADSTRNMMGRDELAQMKRRAILVNTARGGVVDELALLEALREGRLAGAAVDVLATEPPPPDHPLVRANLPNLLITPHVAWASQEAQQTLANSVVENIAAFIRGEHRQRIV